MRVAVGSLARSPGATTWALACATVWPTGAAVLAEADGDGGVLAARLGLSLHPDAPTLVSLLAAGRHAESSSLDLLRHAQTSGGVRVVCGPSGAVAARAAVSRLADRAEAFGVDAPVDLVLDVGRLRPDSSGCRLAEACDVRVVVVRPELEELEPLLAGADTLGAWGPLMVVVRGSGPYGSGEIGNALADRATVWSMPEDAAGVRLLLGQRRGRFDRCALGRAASAWVASIRVGERVV